MLIKGHIFLVATLLCVTCVNSDNNDDSNPFMDIAASFIQESLTNQNAGSGSGLAGIVSMIGGIVRETSTKTRSSGLSPVQFMTGLSNFIAYTTSGGKTNGFDPKLITNVLEIFTANTDSDDTQNGDRNKRASNGQDNGLETILQLASTFMGNSNQVKDESSDTDGLLSLLPMVVQAVNSFSGAEGDKIHDKHKDHAWILPPFLEKIHQMWDHFSNSELAEAMWKKSGVDAIFKVSYILESPR